MLKLSASIIESVSRVRRAWEEKSCVNVVAEVPHVPSVVPK